MEADIYTRIFFFILIIGLTGMRLYFYKKVKKQGGSNIPKKESIQREGKLIFAIRIIGFLILLLLVIGYLCNFKFITIFTISSMMIFKVTGLVIGLLSLLFWTWVQFVLGKEWSTNLQFVDNHTLITHGPYKRIRHPLYLAMTGWFTGLGIVTTNIIFFILLLLILLFLLNRIPKEEKMLIEKFGHEYKNYMKTSGCLFPKIKKN